MHKRSCSRRGRRRPRPRRSERTRAVSDAGERGISGSYRSTGTGRIWSLAIVDFRMSIDENNKSTITKSPNRQSSEPLLLLEQRLLPLGPPAIATRAALSQHNPVTRDEDRYWIGGAGSGHRARRAWAADRCCHISVRTRRA